MAFNWKDFGAAFLTDQAEAIDERTQEARLYKKEQKAAAIRNESLIRDRRARAQQAATYGSQAELLLAAHPQGKQIVRTAIASGMTTISELYEKLSAEANRPGMGGKLGVDDIEAVINMPNIPPLNKSMLDMSLQEYAAQTYGAAKRVTYDDQGIAVLGASEEDDTNIFGRLLGFGQEQQVDRQLSKQDFGGGMSIAGINALAAQENYRSLIPGATMTFMDRNYFDTDKASDFVEQITDAMDNAITSDAGKAYIKARGMAAGGTREDRLAAESIARRVLEVDADKPLVNYYADMYHKGGIFDNILAASTIDRAMGEGYLDDLRKLYAIEEPDTDTTEKPIVPTTQPIVPDTDNPEEARMKLIIDNGPGPVAEADAKLKRIEEGLPAEKELPLEDVVRAALEANDQDKLKALMDEHGTMVVFRVRAKMDAEKKAAGE